MDQRELLRNELRAIITAAKRFVKYMRDRNAHIHAGHFTNVAMRSQTLIQRNDLLLPTYRRQVENLEVEFNYQVQLAYERFPELKKIPKRSISALENAKEPTRSVKVSITLPEYEWLRIDESIKNGNAQSRAEYFRKLQMSKKR